MLPVYRPALFLRRLAFTAGLLLAWILGVPSARGDDWPQWLGPQRDGVWRETDILEKFPAGGPKVLWRTKISGGYAGPAVADGKVYVTDYVADNKKERIFCLNVSDGKVVWKHEYDCTYRISYPAGPRCTPIVAGGKVYTLGAMGDLLCLTADKGEVVWSVNFPRDYQVRPPIWGFSANPLLDGDRLICMVGGKDSCVVAFHKDTGKQVWAALDAREPGYAPPMIYEAGKKRQLIIWHPEAVNSLDPETGKVYWSEKFTARQGLSIPTPQKSGDLLFITAFYDGPLMLRLAKDKPAAEVLWRGKGKSERDTDGLHAIMCTPYFHDGHIYGVCSYGQLRCLKADTGERLWETFQATSGDKPSRWANAFLTPNGDRWFLFNEKGDLIIAKLTPKGYEEIDRAHLLDATGPTGFGERRTVVWSHPAYANRSVFVRNDKEIIRVSLAADKQDK